MLYVQTSKQINRLRVRQIERHVCAESETLTNRQVKKEEGKTKSQQERPQKNINADKQTER
jgi:hypothetical protein